MKAVVMNEFGGENVLRVSDLQKPVPADSEVIIKIAYAGVNPVDWKIREGFLRDMLPHDFPIILGWDAAGIVVEVGRSVNTLKVGDEVFSYVRKPVVNWSESDCNSASCKT
jgi:NADPH:quinone reductase-like Zn-dependent oxidoreductase